MRKYGRKKKSKVKKQEELLHKSFFVLREKGFTLFYDKITGKVVATWFPSSQDLKLNFNDAKVKVNCPKDCLQYLEKHLKEPVPV